MPASEGADCASLVGTLDARHDLHPPMLCSRLERLEGLIERRYIAEPKLDGAACRASLLGSDAERDAAASAVRAVVSVRR